MKRHGHHVNGGQLTIEANEESFVIGLRHGGNDVTCKRSIDGLQSIPRDSNDKDMATMSMDVN